MELHVDETYAGRKNAYFSVHSSLNILSLFF